MYDLYFADSYKKLHDEYLAQYEVLKNCQKLMIFMISWVKCARQAPDGFLSFVRLLRQNCGYFSGHGAFFAGFPALS